MICVASKFEVGCWTLGVRRFLRLSLGVERWALSVRRFPS